MSQESFYNQFKYISENNDINKLNYIIEIIKDKNLLMSYSSMFYNLNFIKHLVEKEFNIHCEDDYVFRLSCNHYKPDIIRYVISLSREHYYINEALVCAAHNGDIEFVKELIDMDGNIHYRNNEAVNWAAGFNQLNMVKFLIKNGAKIDLDYAIQLAKQNRHEKIVDYLNSLNK